MSTSLIDANGFPRDDIDIAQSLLTSRVKANVQFGLCDPKLYICEMITKDSCLA